MSHRQSQIWSPARLVFRSGHVEQLTDVVYFDVWSDRVVGRSLTGVIICLGN